MITKVVKEPKTNIFSNCVTPVSLLEQNLQPTQNYSEKPKNLKNRIF